MLITSSKKYKSQWKENLFQHDSALEDTDECNHFGSVHTWLYKPLTNDDSMWIYKYETRYIH